MLTATSTLYSLGQVFDRSIDQGSTYLGYAYTTQLNFDPAYTMPTPTTEAIYPPTVPHSLNENNFFMGRADGYWIYKLYNNNNIVKIVTLRDQEFYIPVVHDRVESVALPIDPSDTCGHGHDCPEPATGMLLALSAGAVFARKRNK